MKSRSLANAPLTTTAADLPAACDTPIEIAMQNLHALMLILQILPTHELPPVSDRSGLAGEIPAWIQKGRWIAE